VLSFSLSFKRQILHSSVFLRLINVKFLQWVSQKKAMVCFILKIFIKFPILQIIKFWTTNGVLVLCFSLFSNLQLKIWPFCCDKSCLWYLNLLMATIFFYTPISCVIPRIIPVHWGLGIGTSTVTETPLCDSLSVQLLSIQNTEKTVKWLFLSFLAC
jgi:hypothetical protein